MLQFPYYLTALATKCNQIKIRIVLESKTWNQEIYNISKKLIKLSTKVIKVVYVEWD